MTKNNKPILSILIDEDKRVKFADLAKRNNLSMSYLVNQAIDRMLETDSIDIHRDSIVTSAGNYVDSSVGGMNRTDVEELIKSSIVSTDIEQLVKSYVDSHNSSVVSVDDVNTRITTNDRSIEDINRVVAKLLKRFEDIEGRLTDIQSLTASATEAPTRSKQQKPNGNNSYPEWVTSDHTTFYNKLVDNPELRDKVAEAIAIAPNNNALAESLVELGFHKQDGTPLASTPVSRIKKVVSHLRQAPESTLPLFPTND